MDGECRIFASVTPKNVTKMDLKTPQFPVERLYITPFSLYRLYDEEGRKYFLPVEKNTEPSGVRLLDAFVQQLSEGRNTDRFWELAGLSCAEFRHFLLALTGLRFNEFRSRYYLLLADELLRYTDMEVSEVAARCGAGTSVSLFYIYRKLMKTSPTDRRYALRKKGDLGRYKL